MRLGRGDRGFALPARSTCPASGQTTRGANSPTVIYTADAAPGMMKMGSVLVGHEARRRVSGREAVDPLRPRARPTVWPGRRSVPGIVAPGLPGSTRSRMSPPRRPPRPASGGLSVLVITARRSLCPDSGSGTTDARPPANGVPPLCLLGESGSCREHHRIPPGIFGAVSVAVHRGRVMSGGVPEWWRGPASRIGVAVARFGVTIHYFFFSA